MTREKLMSQTNVRLGEATQDEVDAYVRERERETRLPFSRALAVREILDAWATARHSERGRARVVRNG